MKNVKVLWMIIAVLLLVVAALVNKFVLSGSVGATVDGRTSVILNENERNFVLDEMREFLKSVQAVSQAITDKDLDKVATLAHKAGMAAEANNPGELMQKLPLGMKTLGFGTRRLFDDLSAAAKAGKEPLILRKQLDHLMGNCIACHEAYRFPEPKS